ncbi:hypothetical protein [Niallia taxi]|uniref:hypothetical protein n=1 Tax=Niallia taxi TaxID=2499688 RepID=UPI00300A4E26
MTKIHETQIDETKYMNNKEEIFVPSEFKAAQQVTGDRFPEQDYNISTFPKPVRYAGYVLATFLVIMVGFALFAMWL